MLIVPFQDGVRTCNFPLDRRILAFRIIEMLFLLLYRLYIQVKRFIPRLYYYPHFFKLFGDVCDYGRLFRP